MNMRRQPKERRWHHQANGGIANEATIRPIACNSACWVLRGGNNSKQ
jgi:hypothetical protein